ncbi:magnesium transporter MgtE N-terminal domain-containing protein [Kaarinaea lacus]
MIEPLNLAQQFIEQHPAEAAKILETLLPARTSEFLLTVNEETIARTVTSLAADYAALCITLLPMNRKVALFKLLETQTSVDIFRYLPNKEKIRLLNQLPLRKRLAIQTLNKYNQNSVGAWMSTDFISIREEKIVEEVIELIQESDLPNQDYVFVTNAQRQFVSILNTSQLLKAGLKSRISSVRNKTVYNLSARATMQEIAQHEGWKHYTMLPVVEHDMRLVGVLAYEDLTTALEKSHIEFSARTADMGSEALSLFWSLFNNSIQLLNDFSSIILNKKM